MKTVEKGPDLKFQAENAAIEEVSERKKIHKIVIKDKTKICKSGLSPCFCWVSGGVLLLLSLKGKTSRGSISIPSISLPHTIPGLFSAFLKVPLSIINFSSLSLQQTPNYFHLSL